MGIRRRNRPVPVPEKEQTEAFKEIVKSRLAKQQREIAELWKHVHDLETIAEAETVAQPPRRQSARS